jgi:hypothetical protein
MSEPHEITMLGCKHTPGDDCAECFAPYPLKHECGGHLHVEYDRNEDDYEVATVQCDTCEYQEGGEVTGKWPVEV